jgi:hypothetical protein
MPSSVQAAARRPDRPRAAAPSEWQPTPALTAALARLLRSLVEREAGTRSNEHAKCN